MVKMRRNLLELFDNRQMLGTDRLALAAGGQQMEGMLSSGGREKGGGGCIVGLSNMLDKLTSFIIFDCNFLFTNSKKQGIIYSIQEFLGGGVLALEAVRKANRFLYHILGKKTAPYPSIVP